MQSNVDDLPVGAGQKSGPPIEEHGPSQQVDNSGPLEQRLVSKNWLVRANAFEEMATSFRNASNENAQEFRDHSSMWKKYLADANPGSLEKCLDALELFISRADPKLVASFQNEIIKALIEKCVGHAKAAIKTKGLECFNLLFEVTEAFEDSMETITESLQSKNAKISQNALTTLNSWLASYGVKKIKVKAFTQIIENAAGSSNPAIRSEAMAFYKECYKGYGDGVKPLMANIKKQQQDDLDKEFAQLKDKPKQEYRMTRAEKKKAKDRELDDIIKKEEEEKKADSDAFDLYDPVDLITKFGNNEWLEKLTEQKNWKEKKAMLDELLNESNVPKIKPGDFTGVAKVLKKMMGDSNAVVSNTAVKICANLAKGLRKDFEVCCKEIAPALIAKFKEKKTQLIEDCHQVLDAFMLCSNLENLAPEMIAGLSDKAPTVKINVCIFLEKAIQITYIDVLQRISNDILTAVMKTSEDSQGDVRDAALKVLGILKGRLGETSMSKFLTDLNPQKLAKVNESAANVKPSKYDRPLVPEKKPAAASGPAKKGPPAKKAPVKKQESAKEETPMDEPPQNNFDEQPIKGGGFKATFDDMPIGGGGNNQLDEQPIGGKGGYNLDNLNEFDAFGGGGFGNPPPLKKKAPAKPAATKKPPVEEEKGQAEDVVMNDDTMMSPKKAEVKKPPAKQPPEPKAKPSTTSAAPKTAASSKGPSGPQIQEEDVGAGLSKEEAEAKVQETFPSDIVAKFEEAKWQDKVEGFKGIGEQIVSLQPGQDVIEALAKFVKMKMKDWKESNINLIKETINLFKIVAQNCEKVNKRAVACIMPFLSDKIGDVKMVAQTQELLTSLSELVTPKYIALQIIKYASSAKSPNTIKESTNQLIKMTDDFGVINMPLKEMIDYAIVAVNHSNPQVRTTAMALFAIMYQHAGETIKNFLKDIKESTMKLIEEEFAKTTPYKKGEYQQKRRFRGEAAQVEAAAPKKGGAGGLQSLLDDALPRQDISKGLTSKLMPMFKHNDWKVRKEAAEKVEEMCRAANMRIKPDGLNELMDNMKQRMVDPNKAVLKAYIQLMGVLVEALGPAAKQFQKKLLPGMLQTLADKQSLVRNDAIACMDKWAEHVGPEVIINNVGPMLTQENPELRTEALKWIIKQKDAIKTSEVKELTKPLVSCLSDKTPAIRNMGEEVISYVMPFTGYSAFQQVMSDLLPAVQQAIKPILEKVKQKVGVINAPQDQMNGSTGAQMQKPAQATQQQQQQQQTAPALQKQPSLKPTLKAKPPTNTASSNQENQNSQPTQQQQQQKLNQSLSQSIQPMQQKMNQTLNQKKEIQTPASKQSNAAPQRSESKETARPKGLGQSITQFKQEEPPQQEFINVNFGFKEKRSEYDRKSKFQLEEIKGDQLERLKQFTIQVLGAPFTNKMYSNDFKLHVECIESFTQLMQNNPDALKEILDLIFKWALVKLQDSGNTKFAVSIFDFMAGLLQHLEETQYTLWEFEALVVVPLICEKTGINNNILKDKVKKLVKMIFPIYDVKKTYLLIVQYGLNSKNLRAQAECLDELADFITRFGVDYCSEKELKLVAKMADNADKSIRENALKFMGEVYKILDDNIWRALGDVTPKVQGLLEGRFKKLKVGGGLQQSSSQSNFFKPDSANIGRAQSPKQPMKEGMKTQQNFGVKQQIQQSQDMGKQAVTPRGTFTSQLNKSTAKQDVNPQNALSKSINQFNASNRSNEEKKQTPQQVPKKQEMLKKVVSQDQSQLPSSQLNKRPIPQTQRPGESNTDFTQVGRGSEPNQNNMKSSFVGMKQQQVTKNTQMFYDDDDEDLRMLVMDNFKSNPEFDRQLEEITKHIHQLKYADLSKRVDSLVSLNEMISAIEVNKDVLIKTANDLVSAFTHVLNDIFDKNVEDIPLRFAKYFITIVLKTCSCKEIMREVSEEKIFDLAEQLLTRLLIDNLDKVGDNKEGELILKNLNSSMLRLLENCNHTYIFCVLFNLLRKYKDYPLMPKLPNLIIKCLLKLSKILEKLIDKLDMEKILLAIHEYLIVINHENKTQNDEMGIRIVKTVTNELVKLKRESIWEAYRVIQVHGQPDNHIYRWIQIILKSLQTSGSTPSGGSQASQASAEQEIRMLVDELRIPEKFEITIPKLQKFLDQNPQIDLNDYLSDCSRTFQQFIKTNLEKYKVNMKEETKQEYGMMDSMKSTSNSETSNNLPQEPELKMQHSTQSQGTTNRISEYQSKLASIKMRNNQRTGAETATNRDHTGNIGSLQGVGTGSSQNLNTSFSAMNSSLSQKWHEINKKSAATKRDGVQSNVQQMSNTMGGFGPSSSVNFESKIGMGQNATQQPMNQSIGAGSTGDSNMGGGATNQDLNKRLAEMKAKLQALKKK